MKTTTLLVILPLLLAVAACSHGYTPDGSARDDTGINTYTGGNTVPSVMPDDRNRNR
jgi:hypothetical protein